MKYLVAVSCVAVLLSVALGLRDPYTRIEAESMDVNNGTQTHEFSSRRGSKFVDDIQTGEHIGFKQLNFSVETVGFEWQSFNYMIKNPLHRVSLRLDTPTSTPFLTFSMDDIHLLHQNWLTSTILIAICERPRGIHDLYLTFQHPEAPTSQLVAIDWFRFVTLESLLPSSYKAGTVIDCPTPQPCTCPTSQLPNVQPTADHDLQHQVSINQCGNSTESHKQININIY